MRSLSLIAKSLVVAVLSMPAWPVVTPAAGPGFAPIQAQAPIQVQAQPAELPPEMRESCPGLIAGHRPPVTPASLRLAQLQADQMRLTYVGHSTFLIESPQLVRIATDYNDYVKPSVLPDIVTMNRAHSTHYTNNPEPGIAHVLRGWGEGEAPARHDVQYKDVRVRNVPTNIRSWGGGTERHGNSIFIFELGNLCIAHLGHLHHTLTQAQLDEIGRIDVVLVPVDGSYTLDMEGMIEVLRALKAQVMVPMHFFSSYTLGNFLDLARPHFDVVSNEIPSLVLSKSMLPTRPTVIALPGR